MLGTIEALWRYPIKSMGGARHDSIAVDARGIVDDRRWALRTATGSLASGKTSARSGRFQRIDGLLDWAVTLQDAVPVLTTPDGTELRGDDPGIHQELSSRVGQPVTFEVEEGDDDPHFDQAPIHVLTTASLRWLRALLPASAIDERRFRPNVLLDVPGDEPVETSWIGRELALGPEVVLRIVEPTERCVMTTLAQLDLPKDPQVLRAIAQHADARFGVYAEVMCGGTVTVGDPAR
jgi:uncharacterized protein YcbX